MPISDADADKIAQTLLGTALGSSGPKVGVSLQSTYQSVKAIQAVLNPAALAVLVTQAIAALPPSVEVSEATLQAALVGALRELADYAEPVNYDEEADDGGL